MYIRQSSLAISLRRKHCVAEYPVQERTAAERRTPGYSGISQTLSVVYLESRCFNPGRIQVVFPSVSAEEEPSGFPAHARGRMMTIRRVQRRPCIEKSLRLRATARQRKELTEYEGQ